MRCGDSSDVVLLSNLERLHGGRCIDSIPGISRGPNSVCWIGAMCCKQMPRMDVLYSYINKHWPNRLMSYLQILRATAVAEAGLPRAPNAESFDGSRLGLAEYKLKQYPVL